MEDDDGIAVAVWEGIDQLECEKVNLWLKIKNMIGHYGF